LPETFDPSAKKGGQQFVRLSHEWFGYFVNICNRFFWRLLFVTMFFSLPAMRHLFRLEAVPQLKKQLWQS